MPRVSKIQYNPKLSVAENAKKNDVSEAAIRYYIKTHDIDRHLEAKIQIIHNCRAYLEKHPDASMAEVRRSVSTGKVKNGEPVLYSISTIKKYWGEITRAKPIDFDIKNDKIISEFDDGKGRRNTKKVPMMSELLPQAKSMMVLAEQDDVSAFQEWLYSNPTMPLLCIGNGGKHTSFPVILYEMNKGVGKAITPLEFASMSNAAIKSSKILLMSSGGRNMDIVYAAKRAARLNKANTACLCFKDDKNEVIKSLKGNNCFVFKHDTGEGFVSILGKFLTYGLLYKAFSKEEHFAERLNYDIPLEECFKYEVNHEGRIPSFKDIKHLDILYGSFGEPIAREMESLITESGLSSVSISDYRNYCHGRFMLTSNRVQKSMSPKMSDLAIVLLVTPRERRIVSQLRRDVFPDATPVITVSTQFISALASLDLLYKSFAFISVFGEQGKGYNPNNPLNPLSIDKRIPKNEIEFEDDLKKFGALSFTEPDYEQLRKEYKRHVDEFIDKEKETTAYLDKAQPTLLYPTVADLRKEEPEQYDATKVLTYAFRRTDDLRKGKAIPFSNMKQGYPFKIGETPFHTSESAYICGMFSDNKSEHIEVQRMLVAEKNGYSAKKNIRHKNEGIVRKDWNEFNVEWMLYVVWQKVKQNKAFRKLLMSVPENAILIEDTTYQKGKTSAFWGAKNETRKEFCDAVELLLESQNLDISYEEEEKERDKIVNEYCNMGTYVGCNAMGKILTICRKCLADGTEPEIDYELLKSKNIHILGRPIAFER